MPMIPVIDLSAAPNAHAHHDREGIESKAKAHMCVHGVQCSGAVAAQRSRPTKKEKTPRKRKQRTERSKRGNNMQTKNVDGKKGSIHYSVHPINAASAQSVTFSTQLYLSFFKSIYVSIYHHLHLVFYVSMYLSIYLS